MRNSHFSQLVPCLFDVPPSSCLRTRPFAVGTMSCFLRFGPGTRERSASWWACRHHLEPVRAAPHRTTPHHATPHLRPRCLPHCSLIAPPVCPPPCGARGPSRLPSCLRKHGACRPLSHMSWCDPIPSPPCSFFVGVLFPPPSPEGPLPPGQRLLVCVREAHGRTPLAIAAYRNHGELVGLLLRAATAQWTPQAPSSGPAPGAPRPRCAGASVVAFSF